MGLNGSIMINEAWIMAAIAAAHPTVCLLDERERPRDLPPTFVASSPPGLDGWTLLRRTDTLAGPRPAGVRPPPRE
jgi:hypothetical protein